MDRLDPPLNADETDTLLGFLDYQRQTLEWKCTGLDAAALAATTAASTMTLGGLLKHLAYVEDSWSHRWLHGEPMPEPWESIDWTADQDWEWNSAKDDSPDELMAFWKRSVARSSAKFAATLAADGLTAESKKSWPDGRSPSLRWILVHLIEEYARHNGHADLLREAVDGETGE